MPGLQNGSDVLFLSDFLFNSVDEILMGRATIINSYLAAYLLEFYLLVCGVYYLVFIIFLLQKGVSEFLINSLFLNSLKKNYLILGYFFFNPQLYKISGTFCFGLLNISEILIYVKLVFFYFILLFLFFLTSYFKRFAVSVRL